MGQWRGRARRRDKQVRHTFNLLLGWHVLLARSDLAAFLFQNADNSASDVSNINVNKTQVREHNK